MWRVWGSDRTRTGRIPPVGPALGSVLMAGSQTKIFPFQLFVMILAAALKNRSVAVAGSAGGVGKVGMAGELAGMGEASGERTFGLGDVFLILRWILRRISRICRMGAFLGRCRRIWRN